MSSHHKYTDDNDNRNKNSSSEGNKNSAKARDGVQQMQQMVKSMQLRLDEVDKLNHSNENKIAEANAEAEGARKQAERYRNEARRYQKQAERDRKEKEESHKLLVGTFYATFDEVWDFEGANYSSEDFDAMMRIGPPNFESNGHDHFRITLDNAKREDCVATDSSEKSRNSHSTTATRETTWPVDVLHSKFEGRNVAADFLLPPGDRNEYHDQVHQGVEQAQRPLDAQVAHLVPASPVYGSLYHNVARWVFGLRDENVQPPFVQKLIHGSEGKNKQRVPRTGLKHMSCNKILLSGQWNYYDKNPCLIIVPILTLVQAKAWSGEGYQAIMMISSGRKGSRAGLHDVAKGVGMQESGEVATNEEIEFGRVLLKATIKAVAFSTYKKSRTTDDWVKALPARSKDMLSEVQEKLTPVDASQRIIVPEKKRQGNHKPVRRITFGPAFGTGTNSHRAPDPLLLAVKAALTWSMFQEQPLMAAGERDESDAVTSDSSLTVSTGSLENLIPLWELDERNQQDKILLNTAPVITICQ